MVLASGVASRVRCSSPSSRRGKGGTAWDSPWPAPCSRPTEVRSRPSTMGGDAGQRSGSCCHVRGLVPRLSSAEEVLRAPTVVDLFSGAGGLSLGFHAAGCRILAAVDIDAEAGKTFSVNFENLQPEATPVVMAGEDFDLGQMGIAEILGNERPPDIVIGGPPCQGFAVVGRAKDRKSTR